MLLSRHVRTDMIMPTPNFRANNELALHVADPDAAAEFYARVLGCRIANRTPGWIELASGALRMYLVRDPAPTHDRVILSFDVEDREAAVRHLQAAGCTLVPIGPHSPDGFYLRDPAGVVFDVIQRGGSA
ncbi:MAG: hypothetical protein DMD35_18695 [Gemmatimonadetes bacterium]|nr:MAG: hypothetical protein DMD35_18695 [Gemmatimonadota bacterium]